MGTYYAYANLDRKEYLAAVDLPDSNAKCPIDVCAYVLHDLLRGPWRGERIACLGDTEDLPWNDWIDGHGDWVSVLNTDYAQRAIEDWVLLEEEAAAQRSTADPLFLFTPCTDHCTHDHERAMHLLAEGKDPSK